MLRLSVSCRGMITRHLFLFGSLCSVVSLVHRLGVVDAVMKDAVQDAVETPGYFVKVLEGQFAFVQLAVGENPVDDVLHHTLNAVGCGVDQRP
jgi:hypothetical protein